MTAMLSDLRRTAPLGALLAGALVVEFVVMGTIVPASGSGVRGAPSPILFLGLIYGLVSSMTAVGIVLIYRSMRVINFAQTAIGAAGFVLAYNCIVLTPVPFPIAIILGLAVAAGVGLLFELVFVRRFFDAPRIVLTVFTVVAAAFVGASARTAIDSLPLFPERAERSVADLGGTLDISAYLPFRSFSFTILGNPIEFGFIHLFAIGLSLAALVGVGYFLRSTRMGIAVRALAENSERASLLGISVGLVSSVVWAIAGALSGVGSTLNGLLGARGQGAGFSPEILLPALAAAVLARMTSIPIAVVASIGIEVFSRSFSYLQPDLASITNGVLFLIIAIGLLVQRSKEGRSEQGAGTWEATAEIRRVPEELADLGIVRVAQWTIVVLVGAAVVIFPFVTSTGTIYLGAVVGIQAIIALSLVVLTGWTGQVSLGQFALAAVGTVVAGAFGSSIGAPFWIAIPVATAITAGVAIAIGIPALRLPGLFLAVATFAFAAAVRSVLFNERIFGWLLPDEGLERPTLPLLDFEDERSMYFLVVIALGVCLVVVRNLRASRYGRLLIGLRENEPNARSAGVPALRMKLTGFGISGALAGFAGALLAYQQRGVSPDSFSAQASIDVFVVSILGGMGHISGPLVGAVSINAIRNVLASFPELAVSMSPFVALLLLYIAPGGVMSVLAQMRDAVLRIVAQRNGLIVPSLFADVDPESLHLRQVPMSSTLQGEGIERLSRRYDITSVHSDARGDQRDMTDALHLTAAAEAVTEADQLPVEGVHA